jgi:hypothetical protein
MEWKQLPFLKRHGVTQCPAPSGILFQDYDLRVALYSQAVDVWADAKLGASRRQVIQQKSLGIKGNPKSSEIVGAFSEDGLNSSDSKHVIRFQY